jgi:hypothetical protein
MSAIGHLNATRMSVTSHAMLLKSFVGMLALALESKDPLGATARMVMLKQASAASAHFIGRFDADMEAAVNAIVNAAVHDSGAYASPAMNRQRMNDVLDHGRAVYLDLVASMQAVVNGNVGQLLTELRKIRLSASMLQVSRGMTPVGAMMKTRMGRLEEMNFTTPDAAGRKWQSGTFVQALVSKALLQLYTDCFVFCAAVQGDKEIRVIYADSNHAGHGGVLTILGDGEDCYETNKDAIWHPNSTAGVQRVHP